MLVVLRAEFYPQFGKSRAKRAGVFSIRLFTCFLFFLSEGRTEFLIDTPAAYSIHQSSPAFRRLKKSWLSRKPGEWLRSPRQAFSSSAPSFTDCLLLLRVKFLYLYARSAFFLLYSLIKRVTTIYTIIINAPLLTSGYPINIFIMTKTMVIQMTDNNKKILNDFIWTPSFLQ